MPTIRQVKTSCCGASQAPNDGQENDHECCCSQEDEQPESSSGCCGGASHADGDRASNDTGCCGDSMQIPITLYRTTSKLNTADMWDHFQARWGYRRSSHRVEPGLYVLGNPDPTSLVFVSANYTLSFDALRSELKGIDCYILVLDTRGINVWCAAGKGTFGTEELLHRLEVTALREIVSHRRLIVPQLGAPGIAAHEVKKHSGFRVLYGPVRAADIPAYLENNNQATPEMRRVQFTLLDRLTLVPVEFVHTILPTLITAVVLGLLAGPLAAAGTVSAVFAGAVLFPILLPWLPTRDFSSMGLILGGLAALPFAFIAIMTPGSVQWVGPAWALAFLLAIPPVTAYLALNFTGSTTFTSKTGVEREMKVYIPVMAWLFGIGALMVISLTIYGLLG
jgi:hypothetical protein